MLMAHSVSVSKEYTSESSPASSSAYNTADVEIFIPVAVIASLVLCNKEPEEISQNSRAGGLQPKCEPAGIQDRIKLSGLTGLPGS